MNAQRRICLGVDMQSVATEGMALEATSESELVALVRGGSREAGAEFLRRNHGVLRQRIRRRLRHIGRRLFDSQEILSTVFRRLDRMVLRGTVHAINPAALMGLVIEIADHSVVDKARVIDRINRSEGEDSVFAREFQRRIHDSERLTPDSGEDAISSVFEGLSGPREREILGLWLRGCPLKSIAVEMETKPAALRKQWEKIRRKCIKILKNGGEP